MAIPAVGVCILLHLIGSKQLSIMLMQKKRHMGENEKMKLNHLLDVQRYLDRWCDVPAEDLPDDFYAPLEEFFAPNEKDAVQMDLRCFIYNDYMDKKISFEEMLNQIDLLPKGIVID